MVFCVVLYCVIRQVNGYPNKMDAYNRALDRRVDTHLQLAFCPDFYLLLLHHVRGAMYDGICHT